MKPLCLVLVIIGLSLGLGLPKIMIDIEGKATNPFCPISPFCSRNNYIGDVGGVRAVLGPAGKNITVCEHGDVVAVIHGECLDIYNPFEVLIAYSTDSGATWINYGPFSGDFKDIHPGLDATPDFCTNSGRLWFIWQESPNGYNTGDEKMMIEGNVPSDPNFVVPQSLPQASIVFPWMPCIGVAPDNPNYVLASGWSYLNGGNYNEYLWISTNGGYNWTDTIFLMPIDSGYGAPPHFRFGTGGYVFATYHNYYIIGSDTIEYPYYSESTDTGYTWGSEVPLPVPYIDLDSSQFWWHEFDCEVINNEPWSVHADVGLDSIWLFHGTGSAGNWTWETFNVHTLGACSLKIGDTIYYCKPSQFPNISYEPFNNVILISYKAYYFMSTGSDTLYNGAHIGGIYSTNNGISWEITAPLSAPNIGMIPWDDWSATEVAHRLVNISGEVWSYGVWIDESALEIYFDRGRIRPFVPLGIEETALCPKVGALCLRVYPNPYTDKVSVVLRSDGIGKRTDVTGSILDALCIKICDVTGRFIKSLIIPADYSLLSNVVWLGDDNCGQEVPNGVYFIHLESYDGNILMRQKVIKLE